MKIKMESERKSCLTQPEIEERLREAGIQPTAQRIAICRFVLCEADHPSAEAVKDWADRNFPKMSLATVYNTLGALARAGILREFRFPHSEKLIYDSNVSPHYHFLDEETGELYDVTPEQVEIKPKLGKSFQIKDVEVVFRGTRK